MDSIFDPGLVLGLPLWQLDGGTFMSRDAYGHVGIVAGATWQKEGRYFDGIDDDIDFGNPSVLNITDGLTIAAWFRPSGMDEHGYIVSKCNGNKSSGYSLYLSGSTDQIQVIGTNGDSANSDAVFVDDETWVHAAVIAKGGQINFYRNAESAGNASRTIADPSASKLMVGNRDSGTTELVYFKGVIGEILIFGRALTPLEIQRIYQMTGWRYR